MSRPPKPLRLRPKTLCSDGFIGGGRKNWDGSGGNNTALDHYQEMKAAGKEFPLSVKLGTISAPKPSARVLSF